MRLWQALDILKEAFPEFQPPDTETKVCAICEAVVASDKEATREAKAKADAERVSVHGTTFPTNVDKTC
jgi:hypothetical protein